MNSAYFAQQANPMPPLSYHLTGGLYVTDLLSAQSAPAAGGLPGLMRQFTGGGSESGKPPLGAKPGTISTNCST